MEALPSVLLVEDHGATRQSVRQALHDAGFVVHVARDGAAAIAAMSEHRPGIVLQDLVLPDIDGCALAYKLRALAGDDPLRLIAFSGQISNLDARRLAEVGFDDVIAKPVLALRLVELVRAHCEHEAMARSIALRTLHELSDPLAPRASSWPTANHSHQGEGELLRRISALSAELAVMRAISLAMLRHDDVEGALVSALSTCFDAGQSPFGALYLCERDQLRAHSLGVESAVDAGALSSFFGQERWLRAAMQGGRPCSLAEAEPDVRHALAQAGVRDALLVPLLHQAELLGALFMVAPRDARDPSFRRFAQGIGEQVAYALALAEAFRRREHAEREAEQQRRLARDQAAMWRAIVDGAPDIVMQLDAQGRVRFINRTPPHVSSARPLSWFDMFDAEYHEEMRVALGSVFAEGASHTLEISVSGEGETQLWTESHLGPVRSGNEIIGALVIQRDVSEKKQAEAQLIVADRMASVGSLAAAIAHEVNNPLASVLANLELALREAEELGSSGGELLDELQDAREAATRVRSIVRDLHVFSRANDDLFGPIDVERVLDSALRMAWNEVRQRAKLQREFAATPRVYGNESRLGQALLSLTLHAVRNIEEGDADHNTLTVQLYTDAFGRVVVALRDSGPVLSEAARASLLKPFPSARPPADTLGLSICQRVLTEHGGTFTIDCEAGNELRVTLPACSETLREEGRDEVHSEVRALRRGRVLVIDDERLITQVVRRTLAPEHEVVTLDNAPEALRRLRAGERYDAIVCDLMMPGLSGMEFHQRVLNDFPDLAERIVFFTGGAFTPKAREFLQSVPNHRVEKPVAGYELRSVINAMVR